MLAVPIHSSDSLLSSLPQRCLQIGGVSLALASTDSDLLHIPRQIAQFQCDSPTTDLEVTIEWSDRLCNPPLSQCVFDSGALWTLSRDCSDFVFDFKTPVLGSAPYRRMHVDCNLKYAHMELNRELLQRHRPVSALEYPTDELLITNYLAHHGLGVEVHGCGVSDGESGGHLFLGHSGAGKSTTARLWETFRQPEILSDDRIILRMHDGELWMYGTPWHGEAAFASPGRAKLHRICVLQHGNQNKFTALPPAIAVGELFARSFPPFHSAPSLERTVEFLTQVVQAVPCYEFQFTPDFKAIDAVLRFHD